MEGEQQQRLRVGREQPGVADGRGEHVQGAGQRLRRFGGGISRQLEAGLVEADRTVLSGQGCHIGGRGRRGR